MQLNGQSNKMKMVREEELSLFRDLQKRQKELSASLLHSVSQELDFDTNANGKFSLYRIPSGKKEYGLEFLVDTQRNDYDWLKTPPATPLFPSLEMEPSAQLVVQKEIPFSQPLSRFAGSDLEALKPKASDGNADHSHSTTKAKLPIRSITPSHNRHRPSIIKNSNEQEKGTHNAIANKSSNISGKTEQMVASNTKSTTQKQSNNAGFLALNLQKSMGASESQRKPKTRGVPPSVKSRVAANIADFPKETPPNLRTDQRTSSTMRGRTVHEAPPNLRIDQRSSSTTRGRTVTRTSAIVGFQNLDTTPRKCRQSRSPSPSVSNGKWNQLDGTHKNLRTQKERFTLAAGTNESRAHFVGSKMVEKVVNARKSGINNQAERDTKPKLVKYRV